MNLNSTFIILIILFLGLYTPLNAQVNEKTAHRGTIRIKLTDTAISTAKKKSTQFAQKNILVAGAEGYVKTNVAALDQLNQQFEVLQMKRVFRNGGKHEAKHKAWGLHLWYEIKYNSDAELNIVRNAFANIAEVQISELRQEVKQVEHRVVSKTTSTASAQAQALPNGSNDPLFNDQWHYNNTGQNNGTVGKDISLLEAWQLETGNPNVIVAVEDGGVDWDHEDLAANMWVNTGEIPGNGIDDDNNGYVDDIYGYNFADNTGTISVGDHGTHVAGTVAAVTNNGKGVAGVAGGSGNGDGVRIMSCNVFGASNGGFDEALIYAADNGAVISQNSWGYTSAGVKEQSVLDAIDYFIANAGGTNAPMNGGLVIFAAGNDNKDGEWYPGYYNKCLAVAATNKNDVKSYYSNYGTWVDISAPGGELETSNTDPTAIHSTLPNNQYGVMQGTSMACPHVSGVAALIVSRYAGNITPQQVWDYLVDNTDPIENLNSGYINKLGSGRMNAYAALSAGQITIPNTPTNLQITETKATAFTATWNASAGAASYDVAVRSLGAPNWSVHNTTSTSISITELNKSTTYQWRVLAKNTAGSSAYSSTQEVTTKDSDPIVYCNSQGKDASYEWIAKVQVGDFTKSSGSASYSDFTAETIALSSGQSYPITLTPAFKSTTYNEYWKVWIDYNQDGNFDTNELAFDAGAVSKTAVSGTIQIPTSAQGTMRMRVSMKYNGAQTSACEAFDYGEVEDYTVSIQQGSATCSTPTNLSVASVTHNSASISWSAVAEAQGYQLEYRQAGGTWAATTTSTPSHLLTSLSANANYEVRVRTACSFGQSDYSALLPFTTEQAPVVTQYCSTGANNNTYEWIDLVEIGTIQRTSGADGGYADLTSLSATLQRGAEATIYLSAGFKSSSYTENWYVWIDLNQDGDFEDTDELLVSGSSSSSARLQASFTLPASTTLGTTRMRVTMSDSKTSSCGTYNYGETEDYTIVVSDAAPAQVAKLAHAEGLNSKEVETGLFVYPNPVVQNLQIKSKIISDASIRIFSLNGTLLKSTRIQNNSPIAVSDLNAGTYIITVSDGQKTWQQQFIKQ
jgi:subtilisin family serine protease